MAYKGVPWDGTKGSGLKQPLNKINRNVTTEEGTKAIVTQGGKDITGTENGSKLAIETHQLRYPIQLNAFDDEPWIRYQIFSFTPKGTTAAIGSNQPAFKNSGFQNKPVVSKIDHTIAMPFDQQIAITNAQKWNPAGERAGVMDNVNADGASGAVNAVGEFFTSKLNKVSKFGTTGSAAGEQLTDKVALEYEGPEQRSFTLTHTMIPKSAAEEKNIQSIIKMFRWSSAPKFKSDNSTATSYGFPHLYRVSWMLGAKENRNIPHYDIAYLSSVAVTFGDDNFSRFEGGAPTVYEMTLSFTEMEFINKEHIDKNFL
jgi:hypothetical protein